MKKLLLLFILFFNLFPAIRDDGFAFFENRCYAQSFAEEEGENCHGEITMYVETIGCTEIYFHFTRTYDCKDWSIIGEDEFLHDEQVPIPGCYPDYYDCNGVLNGTAVNKPCGCVDISEDCPEEPEEPMDCAGVSGGMAYDPGCGCIGGTTGLTECPPTDCNGEVGGTAYMADCGCIGGSTGIAECPPPACLVTINLLSLNTSVLPNEQLHLSGSIVTQGTVFFIEKTLEVSNDNTWYPCSERLTENGTNISVDIRVKVLGDIKYRVKGVYTCNNGDEITVYSIEISTNSKYCASNLSTDYATEMNTAWTNTIAQSQANHGTKFENGFSVTFAGTSGAFIINTASASTSCESNEINLPLVDEPIGPIYPDLGASLTIGNFHTHPPLTYCPPEKIIEPGPSSKDTEHTARYPRIVRTYSSTVSGGHYIGSSTSDYITLGLNCTTY